MKQVFTQLPSDTKTNSSKTFHTVKIKTNMWDRNVNNCMHKYLFSSGFGRLVDLGVHLEQVGPKWSPDSAKLGHTVWSTRVLLKPHPLNHKPNIFIYSTTSFPFKMIPFKVFYYQNSVLTVTVYQKYTHLIHLKKFNKSCELTSNVQHCLFGPQPTTNTINSKLPEHPDSVISVFYARLGSPPAPFATKHLLKPQRFKRNPL